jgi:uncharacterized protein (DUF169 family)
MSTIQPDYSVFDRLGLESKPTGVKFLATKPEGIARIKKGPAFCEMFKEAQEKGPFYVQREDFVCVEPMLLGMEDPQPPLISGMAGGTGGLYKEARATRKVYQYIPRMLKGSVTCVAFAPVDQMTFDPDVLIITANVRQARHVMRAVGYSSGEMWSCQGTPVMACAWLYNYPVLSGKMNFTVTGLSLGMEAINFSLPEGQFLISVPWNLLPTVMDNLQDDNLYRNFRAPSREAHFEGFHKALSELSQEMSNC